MKKDARPYTAGLSTPRVGDDPVAEPRGRRAVHTIESGAAAAAPAPNPNSRSGDGGQQAAPAVGPIADRSADQRRWENL